MTYAALLGTRLQFWRLWADDGQNLLEFGLLVALIALLAIGALTAVGQQVDVGLLQNVDVIVPRDAPASI